MATDTLPARTNGQTIDQNWFNLLRTVIGTDFVPRNSSGVATAVAGSLGQSALPWLSLFLGAAASNLKISESSSGIKLEAGASSNYVLITPTTFEFYIGGTRKFYCDTNGISVTSHKAPNIITSSTSTGAFNTNSTSYTNITNATLDITLTGSRPVKVWFDSRYNVVQECGHLVEKTTNATDVKAVVRIIRGVTDICYHAIRLDATGASPGLIGVPPAAVSFMDDAPPAGVQTYTAQVSVATSAHNYYGVHMSLKAQEIVA